MSIILAIFLCFQAIIIVQLLLPWLLMIVTIMRNDDVAGLIPNSEPDYGIIVTAYEQVNLIPSVVSSLLTLNYKNYHIYVVADNCDISTLTFHNTKVSILKPENILASNVKSHFYAIERFVRPHERLTIIDSDNLVDPQYLSELNKAFAKGYKAVQGVRKAKNLNTNVACLDAANDIYYRYVDKYLLTKAGSSSSLSGSGMAFTTALYQNCLAKNQTSGAGFDKILQFEILAREEKITFCSTAIVYDEKTAKSDQLVKQRARWINTWFKFFKLGLRLCLISMKNLNWNQFVFSIMLLRPPLFVMVLLSIPFIAMDAFFAPQFALLYLVSSFGFIIVFIRSLVFFQADPKIFQSLRAIPKFMFFQILALVKARKANQYSVATKHEGNAMDEH